MLHCKLINCESYAFLINNLFKDQIFNGIVVKPLEKKNYLIIKKYTLF